MRPGCATATVELHIERVIEDMRLVFTAIDLAQPTPSAALGKGQDREESARSTPTKERRIKLRRILDELFNIAELRGLCFDMHIDFEELAGETKPDRVIALIEFCERRGRTLELETKVYTLRPNVS